MVCVKGLYWQEIIVLASDQSPVVQSDRSGRLDATVNPGIFFFFFFFLVSFIISSPS